MHPGYGRSPKVMQQTSTIAFAQLGYCNSWWKTGRPHLAQLHAATNGSDSSGPHHLRHAASTGWTSPTTTPDGSRRSDGLVVDQFGLVKKKKEGFLMSGCNHQKTESAAEADVFDNFTDGSDSPAQVHLRQAAKHQFKDDRRISNNFTDGYDAPPQVSFAKQKSISLRTIEEVEECTVIVCRSQSKVFQMSSSSIASYIIIIC